MGLSRALVSSLRWKKRSWKAMIRGRRKRRRGGDDWIAPEIPWEIEIEIEILLRLPAKSLMRFKCVSKLWSCLIHSRYFCNRYLTVASPPQPPNLYMSLVDQLEPARVIVGTRESVLLSLSSSSSTDGAEYLSPDLILAQLGGLHMVVIRGLIFYSVPTEPCSIYNPTTGQFITLAAINPKISAPKGFSKHYSFGYDPVLDQYKVVCTFLIASKKRKRITSSEHWVYTVEAGGSWKRIEFNGPAHCPARPGLCINGVIYYLASTCMSRDIVVSFDVRSEEFNMTQAPDDALPAYGKPVGVGFIEYGGKPAILDHTNLVPMGLVELWVLEDGGKWSKKSLVLKPCQMHLVANNMSLLVHGTTINGEVILAPISFFSPYYILYYDLQNNDLRKVEIRGIPDHWFSKPDMNVLMYLTQLDESESIIHLEI